MAPDIDHFGGYTLYRDETPLMRWYYLSMDHTREFFNIVPLDVPPEEREYLLVKKIWMPIGSMRRGDLWYNKGRDLTKEELDEIVEFHELGGEYYIQDHLTGCRIPNESYMVWTGWPTMNHFEMILKMKGRCSCGKLECACQETWRFAGMIFLQWLRQCMIVLWRQLGDILRKRVNQQKIPEYVVQAGAWKRQAAESLCKTVKEYVASQSFLVLDLRRSGYFMPCPLEAEDIQHMELFALALPGELKFPQQREMLSWVSPEKVVELTVFEPLSLDDYQQFTNLQRLFLLKPEPSFALDGINDFPKLEKQFISGNKDIEKLCETQTLPQNLDVELAFDKPVTQE